MNDKDFLKLAVEQAKKSVEKGGFPAGAVVVKDGEVVSQAASLGLLINDPTSHAETAAIREACQKLQTIDLLGATLYESLESCNMCFSVAYWAGIGKIVFGARKNKEMAEKGYYEGATDIGKLNGENNRKIERVFIPDFEKESLGLVKGWESKNI